jgi:hypothetical protein
MAIDFEQSGGIGVAITAPTIVLVTDLNRVLAELGAQPIPRDDLTPPTAA